jgi:hypothetical protein
MTPTISPSMRHKTSGHQRVHPSAPGRKQCARQLLARVQLKVRYSPEVHANFSGARCRQVGQRLHCLAKHVSEGNFWLKRACKDLELLLTTAGEA